MEDEAFPSMKYYNEQDKRMEYFLSDETDNGSFDWSLFRRKKHYGIHLEKTKGYWQVLGKQHKLTHDLKPIKLMLMHKGIATTVLNKNTDVTIHLNGKSLFVSIMIRIK